jgi:hypothetical protein
MSDHLLTDRNGITDIRRKINGLRGDIGYDVINSPHSNEFEELEVLLSDAVVKCDEIHDLISHHVYAYDVTVTITRRVYVKGRNEEDTEQAAIDYAMEELSPPLDWSEDDVQVFRDECEETTRVYDVEV